METHPTLTHYSSLSMGSNLEPRPHLPPHLAKSISTRTRAVRMTMAKRVRKRMMRRNHRTTMVSMEVKTSTARTALSRTTTQARRSLTITINEELTEVQLSAITQGSSQCTVLTHKGLPKDTIPSIRTGWTKSRDLVMITAMVVKDHTRASIATMSCRLSSIMIAVLSTTMGKTLLQQHQVTFPTQTTIALR